MTVAISIHALLAESDPRNKLQQFQHSSFQSTLSLRRATFSFDLYFKFRPDFNPRSPCGERQPFDWQRVAEGTISIHALLAESDAWRVGKYVLYVVFQSTLSLRRATANTTKLALSFLSKVPI